MNLAFQLEFHRSLTEAVEVKRKVTTSGYSEAKEGPRVKSPPLPRRRIPVTQDSVVPTEAKPQPPTKDAHRVDHDRQTREQERSRRDQKRHTSSRSQSGGGGGSKSERRGLGHEREGERQRVRDRDKENVVGGGQHPQPPIREWDRDKIGEKSPGERARAARNRNRSSLSRSRSRSRGARSPLPPDGFGRRDRDRDRDRGRMGSGPRDRRDKRIDRG